MTGSDFRKELSKQLYPMLKAQGFTGSGSILRRIAPPVIHIFQVRCTSREAYLELGAHLDFLPAEGGVPVPIEKLQEMECAFRGQFEPPAGRAFGWSYGDSPVELSETVEYICYHWDDYAGDFFARHGTYPESFVALVRAGVQKPPHPMDCLKLARIARHLDLREEGIQLLHSGLSRCGEQARILKANLNQLLDELEAR